MKELLYNSAEKIGIKLSDIQLEQFNIYYDLLIETNKTINLTNITEEKDVVYKHFIDSIALKSYIDISKEKVIDIGTGAGFPGIPLAIVFSDAEFTLVDSINKKIQFLNNAIKKCRLDNIKTVHSRSEDLGHNDNYREQYNYCVSRAVANMSILLEYCIPFVKKGGKFIAYKSGKADNEIIQSTNAQKKLSCEFYKSYSFEIPETDISRKFVIFNKIDCLSEKYPRQAGKARKNPL